MSIPLHEPLSIVADDRERASAAFAALEADPGVDLEVRRLELGDYEIDGRILIERKSLLDLAESIRDGRLLAQACRLASSPLHSILILEGTGTMLASTGMGRGAIQGALVTVSLVLGIPILRSLDGEETARLMLYAGRQIHRIASGGLPRKGKRPRGKKRSQLEILQSLPGIGPERARRLLKRFGSVERVIAAGADELCEVPGIGRRIADRIRWVVSEEGVVYEKSEPGEADMCEHLAEEPCCNMTIGNIQESGITIAL